MPCCPSCGKGGFKDNTAVANHMSQPTSGCNTWIDNLVSLHDNIDPRAQAAHCPAPVFVPQSNSKDLAGMDIDTDETVPPITQPRSELPLAGSLQQTCDTFPGAAKIFASGVTFMDRFDADQLSNFRSTNLYYPFASCEEWELAAWLLRLGLSMRAIDAFLKLSKVCPIINMFPSSIHWRQDMKT